MIALTASELAEIVDGTLINGLDPETVVTGTVHYDSRKVAAGDVFFAMPGARVDGHDFVPTVYEQGASFAVVTSHIDQPALLLNPQSTDDASNQLAFASDDDGRLRRTVTALSDLASAVVKTLVDDHGLTVVGITGSAGKTTTKDMLGAVLSSVGETIAPSGSLNNEIGFPWTALQATTSTRFLVLETSARGVGHIEHLCSIVAPHTAVVLNVGSAHIGEFGSQQIIAQAKSELVAHIDTSISSPCAVLNADDPLVAAIHSADSVTRILFGLSTSAHVRAENVTTNALGCAQFDVVIHGQSYGSLQLNIPGEHQVSNALSVIATAVSLDLQIPPMLTQLAAVSTISSGRMAMTQCRNNITVINDAYNANPESMRSALKTIAVMARAADARTPRKTWAILGYMAELGEEEILAHDALGRFAVRIDISKIIVVGKGRPMRALLQGAIQEGSWGDEALHFEDISQAMSYVTEHVGQDDIVLFKASNSIGLGAVADTFAAEIGAGQL